MEKILTFISDSLRTVGIEVQNHLDKGYKYKETVKFEYGKDIISGKIFTGFIILTKDEPKVSDLQKLMNDVYEWSSETFGDLQDNPAIAFHLQKETQELIDALVDYQDGNSIKDLKKSNELQKKVRNEFADCLNLLIDSASHFGLSANDLVTEARKKLEICKKRKWGKPDENGVIEHIPEEESK